MARQIDDGQRRTSSSLHESSAVTQAAPAETALAPELAGMPKYAVDGSIVTLPRVPLPVAPDAAMLWFTAVVVAWVLLGYFLLDQLTLVLMDLWLLESLGYASVFWTNFGMGAALFVLAFAVFAAAIAAPAFLHPVSRRARRFVVQAGLFVGLLAGYFLAQRYLEYLLLLNGRAFGETDPVFGMDMSWYAFAQPALQTTLTAASWCAFFGLIASIGCAYLASWWRTDRPGMNRVLAGVGIISTPYTLAMLALLGVFGAVGVWLSRFDLLFKEQDKGKGNVDSAATYVGANYLDVTGLFSTLNDLYVSALVVVGIAAVVVFMLWTLHRAVASATATTWQRPLRSAAVVLVALLAFDLSFKGLVALRDILEVSPNEPVVQFPYIQRHIDATLRGYGLDKLESVSFIPKKPGDPVPDVERLLQSPTFKNVPLWPGYVSYHERLPDPYKLPAILAADEDMKIYGPTQDIFRQQQQLRAYYDFLDIDNVRYRINGEPRLFASAVRELPLVEPQPWSTWWGQRFILFTHGFGMVMVPMSESGSEGEPSYAISGIPSQTASPELRLENERVYYGEGARIMAFSNIQGVKELDYPTEEGRAEIELPQGATTALPMDSLLKRIVFGWRSQLFWEMVMSGLIGPQTVVHYYRTPIERAERVAPFLYYDNDKYAVIADGRIVWMINGITTTDRYPYSRHGWLGEKADERTPFPRPDRKVNYARDSVKVTTDAYTGQVQFYKWADEPIVDTWASVYPGLFQAKQAMPPSLRDQVQYPGQLFHTQFDDIYVYYHQTDAVTYFNAEDLWDDADEVKGQTTIGGQPAAGKVIRYSMEPYPWIAQTGGVLPGPPGGTQFSWAMLFTNEAALNLRAIPIVYQDGDDYGRLTVLTVPKGHYSMGPEQADAAIDQDPTIAADFSLWMTSGSDVIRGHTTAMLVDGEVIYVEPIFIRSKQNPVPQLKRVAVVFREKVSVGETLEQALRAAIEKERALAGVQR